MEHREIYWTEQLTHCKNLSQFFNKSDHCADVAERMPTLKLKCIAWLHDTPMTRTELIRQEVAPEVVCAIVRLTMPIRSVKEDLLATTVKEADLMQHIQDGEDLQEELDELRCR
tara:strand:+ start:164 stop:505 length:342 start_codon:yes stop_codon:yes gene_type:complete